MSSILQDFRYALRLLLKSPGFTVLAVLTLGLGIGANVTVFSVLNSVIVRSLPLPQPEQLVRLYSDWEPAFPIATFPRQISWIGEKETRCLPVSLVAGSKTLDSNELMERKR